MRCEKSIFCVAFAAPAKATFRVGKAGAGKSIFRVAKKAPRFMRCEFDKFYNLS